MTWLYPLAQEKKAIFMVVSNFRLEIANKTDFNQQPPFIIIEGAVFYSFFYHENMIWYASKNQFLNENFKFSCSIFIGHQISQKRALLDIIIKVLETGNSDLIKQIFDILNLYINKIETNKTDFSFQKLFIIIKQNRYSLNKLILDLEKTLLTSTNKIILNNDYSKISNNFIRDCPELPLLSDLDSKNIMKELYNDNFELNILDIKNIYDDLKLNPDIHLLKIIYNTSPYIFELSCRLDNKNFKNKIFNFINKHSFFHKKFIFYNDFKKLEPLSIISLVFDTGKDNYHDLDNYYKSLILILIKCKNKSN